jgi:ABC-2 type transport system permease protein
MLIYQGLVSIGQSTIIVALALAPGARFSNGAFGVILLILASMLVNLSFASLSIALGLILRKEESVIAAVQFLALPLTFLGAGFMDARLMPGWIQAVAHSNPFNWAVEAGRRALEANPDWGFVLARGSWLLALALVCWLLATMAFRSYQRSV